MLDVQKLITVKEIVLKRCLITSDTLIPSFMPGSEAVLRLFCIFTVMAALIYCSDLKYLLFMVILAIGRSQKYQSDKARRQGGWGPHCLYGCLPTEQPSAAVFILCLISYSHVLTKEDFQNCVSKSPEWWDKVLRVRISLKVKKGCVSFTTIF